MSELVENRNRSLSSVLTAAPVVPVLTIDDRAQAVPLAKALVDGGLTALEVTLRTSAALDSIRAILAEVPGANVGAGTVTTAEQYHAVEKLGVKFVVSPGATPTLISAASYSPVPYLPGVATAGEAMTLYEAGYRTLKFFPAEQAGGVAYLKALAAPLPDVRFCPTGGVGVGNAAAYLALPNVICVGGSWVAPAPALASADWARVTALARAAAGLKAV
ncbi:MAG TPA: bifunctional 4-hydroxy-2-oxoglutarate aldolase/2-dehydro-3-deoxy-phosphogluconate aldolase [Bauldia sp.]|nr:bifunctional 4-hydroxy-2-oxoglutarate aldolase/2-dehydro-3-deoxy-phosphogluconate aldolase [Bauldia sp.]